MKTNDYQQQRPRVIAITKSQDKPYPDAVFVSLFLLALSFLLLSLLLLLP